MRAVQFKARRGTPSCRADAMYRKLSDSGAPLCVNTVWSISCEAGSPPSLSPWTGSAREYRSKKTWLRAERTAGGAASPSSVFCTSLLTASTSPWTASTTLCSSPTGTVATASAPFSTPSWFITVWLLSSWSKATHSSILTRSASSLTMVSREMLTKRPPSVCKTWCQNTLCALAKCSPGYDLVLRTRSSEVLTGHQQPLLISASSCPGAQAAYLKKNRKSSGLARWFCTSSIACSDPP
mmetsp:Transcript_45162/g.92188  ORF Transcript_45162/g.92188 Transcript_45162/m.92188 type:complete len:239 (+) Transcript_45162:1295-2011(+)